MFAPVAPELTDGLARLTDEQQAAVAHGDGNLLVVAGAGTGKTTMLAARLAGLIGRGVPPGRIVLLAFTRRAAAELVHRAEVATGTDAGACWAGTFHSVANRFLRRYGRAVGVEPDFTVLDSADTADLLSLVADELRPPGAPARRRPGPGTTAAIWSRCVATRRPLGEVLERWYPWCRDHHDELRDVYRAYVARKAAHHLLDYDDLLLQWWALLRTPEVAALVAEQVTHVLVDELQDTCELQADILDLLAGRGVHVTAVGDDAQAIYGFRAASPKVVLDFPRRFSATTVTLTRNHRSTPQVLSVANAVMAPAAQRVPKELRAERGAGPRPRLVTCHDEHAQAVAVADAVVARHDAGLALRRQAVLFRAAHHSDLLQLELSVRKVPYKVYGGLRFLEAAHIKDLLAVLRVAVNPRDELAWFRTLQLIDRVGPATARRLTTSLVDGADLARAAALVDLDERAVEQLVALDDALEAARTATAPRGAGDDGAPSSAGAQVAAVRRWLDGRVAARYRGAGVRTDDLARLEQAAATAPSLHRFLTELTLDPPAGTGDLAGPPHLDDDYLVLSTIHSAKGGEWDVVHVIHLADGCLPSDLATGDAEQVEEERRLLHVATTRARDELWLHVPLRYHHHRQNPRRADRHGFAPRSRFLTDEVVRHCDEVAAEPAGGDPDVAEAVARGPGAAAVQDLLATLLE